MGVDKSGLLAGAERSEPAGEARTTESGSNGRRELPGKASASPLFS